MTSAPEPDATVALTPRDFALVREVIGGGGAVMEVGQNLDGSGRSDGSEPLRLIGVAFSYVLVRAQETGRRSAVGGPYAPGYPQATALPEMPPAVLAVWRLARDELADIPLADARLSDVLYVVEGRSAHADGRRAAAAMTVLAEDRARPPTERAEHASRALEILTELGDKEGVQRTADRVVAVVDSMLAGGTPLSGPVFAILQALLSVKSKQRSRQTGELLTRTASAFVGAPAEDDALTLIAAETRPVPDAMCSSSDNCS